MDGLIHCGSPVENTKKNRHRRKKRNIIWFNPPYNKGVSTNVGKEFLKLISKHFPKGSKLSPILNRNTVKISYSCTKNIKQIIQAQNQKILQKQVIQPTEEKKCNCQARFKDKCPLEGNCKQTNVIYHAKIIEGEPKEYIGSTIDFKRRFYGHKNSFKNTNSKNNTTLSSYVWEAGLNPEPKIKWSIITRASPYSKGNRQCDLCASEKLHISKNLNNPNYINRRTELALRCGHRRKFLLVPPDD